MERRRWISVIVAVVIAFVMTLGIVQRRHMLLDAKVALTQRKLAKEVFRFHVLANSDDKKDQALKMKVKGEVLSYMKKEIPHADSADMTRQWAKKHVKDIEYLAHRVVLREGYRYPVRVCVTTCYFPDKTYGDVTFPKGNYEALRIEIGEAKGHNWWCVLYPNLCFMDAVHAVVPEEGKEELKEVLDEESYEMVTATSHFRIKWFFFAR